MNASRKLEAQEIRDGLFSVSWILKNLLPPDLLSLQYFRNRQQPLPNTFLSCKVDEHCVLTLEMGTTAPPDSLRRIVATASSHIENTKRRMTLSESTWKISWTIPEEWISQSPYPANFDILIDFKPDSVLSVKNGQKNVLENLEELWERKTLSDVAFKCGDQVIEAHTSILASGSPVFAAMFQNDFKESQERTVLIQDIEAKVLEILFRYIYVGKCDLLEEEDQDENEVAEILVAADKYAVDSLKNDCESHLSKILTVENATQFFVWAHLHNSPKLRKSALNFVAKNAEAIVARKEELMEIMRTHPELYYEAMQYISQQGLPRILKVTFPKFQKNGRFV